MPTDALDDFVQLTQALGGFTESVGQLYNMKVKVEADKYAMDIGKMDTAFLTDMMRPAGDPNRIEVRSFRDRLTAYNQDLDNRIGQITNPAVRDAVARNYQSSRNEFNLRVAEKFMAQEVANTQATWKSGLQEYMTLPVDPTQLENHLAGLEAKFAEARSIGMFDEATLLSLEAPALTYDKGRIIVRDELAASGGVYDAAALAIVNGKYDDSVRSAAINELTKQGQNANASFDAAMAQAFPQGSTATYADRMKYIDENFHGTSAHEQEVRASVFALGLTSGITGVSVWVDTATSAKDRTYWGLMMQKERLASAIASPDNPFNGNNDYTDKMEQELNRLQVEADRLKDAEGGSLEKRKSALWSQFLTLESLFTSKGLVDMPDGRRRVTLEDLYALQLSAQRDPELGETAKQIKDRLANNAEYKQYFQDFDKFMGSGEGSAVLYAFTRVLADPTKKWGVKPDELKDLLTGGEGAKVDVDDRNKFNLVVSDIITKTNAYLHSGEFHTQQEIRDYMLRLAVPYLQHWDVIDVLPKAGTKQLVDYGRMVDEGALNLSGGVDPLTGTTISPKSFEKAYSLYRSTAKDVITKLSASGAMPPFDQLTFAPQYANQGDLAWTKTGMPGYYSFDVSSSGDLVVMYHRDQKAPGVIVTAKR